MIHGGKPGLAVRRRNALKMLENQLNNFKKDGKDKEPHYSTRNGGKRKIFHQGRSFDQEVIRLENEISHLKTLLSTSKY